MIERPRPDEYASYYGSYIDLVPAGPILATLARQSEETHALLSPLDEARAGHRYAPGKWSVKQVLGHLVDTERIFAYRGLCIGRGDTTPLPGMDQDVYVDGANFDQQSLAQLLDQLLIQRRATLALFASFDDAVSERRGIANQLEITARAFPYIIAGHELHHLRVLRERYLC
jgi:hypothetical protein